MARVMFAKFGGKCDVCGHPFPKGETISYNGRASHVACAEQAAERQAREDAEDNARMAADLAEFRAGARATVRMTDGEIIVDRVPTYEMARDEARAFVASISAATGARVSLRKHKSGGKWFLGRTLVHYYSGSNLPHHEGWAFKYA